MTRAHHIPLLSHLHSTTMLVLTAIETSGDQGHDCGQLFTILEPHVNASEFSELVGQLVAAGIIQRAGERYFKA